MKSSKSMWSLETNKKRKTTTTTEKKKLSPNPSLPDDLLLSIVARVSRLYYPTLSLVSKSFRSLLASPELYKARSLSGHTESCLYVCLQCCPGYRWFTLCRKPDQTLSNYTTKKKSSGYVLATVPIPSFQKGSFSSLVAVGSDIYNIGGSNYHGPSYSVSILDCRSHTWREAPRLRVEQLCLSASVLDRKIYVAGCYNDSDSNSLKNFLEVFDTKTQIWDTEPIACSGRIDNFLYSKSTCIDGKFHVVTEREGVIAYDSKKGRWDRTGQSLYYLIYSNSFCEIENVLYFVSDGEFMWYDTELKMWRDMEGLVGRLSRLPPDVSVRLADNSGKLAVLWEEEDLPYCRPGFTGMKKIWCAEIALEKRKSKILGKIEWFDHVLTVPAENDLVKVLAATV
ncbi:unnamed protein product [Arabidopsis lyrata]|nr:unnamed protein product [Arabidopsis lyrata]